MPFDHLDPAYRRSVSYIDKSREFYQAHGYDKPYRWATNPDAPFTPLDKPLSECRVGVVTTSSLHHEDRPGDDDPPASKQVYHQPSWPPPDRMFTNDLSWHKTATHTNDTETFLPLTHLRELAAEEKIGAVSERYYGVPTEYSQRKTGEDAHAIEQWCREDQVDVVLLIPL